MRPPHELAAAAAAALDAAVLCRRLQHGLDDVARVLKSDGTLVTVADYAAQALVHRHLAESCDVRATMGEESAEALAADPALLARVVTAVRAESTWTDATEEAVLDAIGYRAWNAASGAAPPRDYWTVDPIDGTRGFAAGRHYAVCIARVIDARPVLAVVASPNLPAGPLDAVPAVDARGYLMAGAAGPGGLWWSHCEAGAPLTAHARASSSPGVPRLTFSVEPTERRQEEFDRLSGALGPTRPPLQIDSQAKYVAVARGEADVYFRPARRGKEKVWDHAAGCLLLELSGCRVTDALGRPLDWTGPALTDNHGLLGAAPALHERILRILTG